MRTAKDILTEHIKRLMATVGQEEYQPLDEIEASEEYAACVEAMKEYAHKAIEEAANLCDDREDNRWEHKNSILYLLKKLE